MIHHRAHTYRIVIRDNKTRETREYEMGEWFDHTLFYLTEGNFSCDCNRGMSFARAGGMSEEEIWSRNGENDDPFPCGESRYSIIEAVLSDGRRVSVDGEGAPPGFKLVKTDENGLLLHRSQWRLECTEE